MKQQYYNEFIEMSTNPIKGKNYRKGYFFAQQVILSELMKLGYKITINKTKDKNGITASKKVNGLVTDFNASIVLMIDAPPNPNQDETYISAVGSVSYEWSVRGQYYKKSLAPDVTLIYKGVRWWEAIPKHEEKRPAFDHISYNTKSTPKPKEVMISFKNTIIKSIHNSMVSAIKAQLDKRYNLENKFIAKVFKTC